MKKQKKMNKMSTMPRLKKKKNVFMKANNGQIQYDHLIKIKKQKKSLSRKWLKLYKKFKKLKNRSNRMNHTLRIWRKNIKKSNNLIKIMIKF